jgi:dipeptidyl aminopeptidase/acylaminoacyl peptidase
MMGRLFHKLSWCLAMIVAGAMLVACDPGESNSVETTSPPETDPVAQAGDVATASYGAWASPVSADDLAGGFRPKESGRTVLMRRIGDGAPQELTSPDFQVRTLVHEYGGRAYVAHDGLVYFSNYADQQIYRQDLDGETVQLTDEDGLRYADCTVEAARERLICVREDHRGDGEPKNTITAISLSGGRSEVLFEGTDFVAYPRMSADGKQMAWISWDHPNMPWDAVTLWVADVSDAGTLRNAKRLNDGMEEAIVQPEWAPDGTLYFVSDRSEWWNIYRYRDGAISIVLKQSAEFGGPLWKLGSRYFSLTADGRILASVKEDEEKRLVLIDPETAVSRPVDLGSGGSSDFVVAGNIIHAVVHYADGLDAIVRVDAALGESEVVRVAGQRGLDDEFISHPEAVTFPTGDGTVAHGYYYPPRNPDFEGPKDVLPPLIVKVHGGPTAATNPYFDLDIQYWTTRGFAVMDVDYRGSTGYGRAYRKSLYGQWGIADIEDTVNAARYAAENGLADKDKLLVRGGSAGGFVVLASMAFHNVFKAGASYFGISDLEALVQETHKFESRYSDQLIGPYPERKELYKARSPINHLDGMSEPLILFQGLEDKVVPPNQSEMIADALRAKGVPVAYLAFEGEQHGFRMAENRKRSREAELYFYGKILGFTPADAIEPVEIDNLAAE